MIGQESFDGARPRFLETEQLLEHVEHSARIEAGRRHESDAEVVGFLFVGTTESRHRTAGDDVRENRLQRVRILAEENAADDADLLLLLDLFDGVPRDDVRDLVRHHAGEHVRFVGLCDQSGVDVDVTTGKRERVHVRIVDDFEIERPARERRPRVNALADAANVRVQPRVAIELNLLIDLRSELITELPLLIERDRTTGRSERSTRSA